MSELLELIGFIIGYWLAFTEELPWSFTKSYIEWVHIIKMKKR